MRYNFNPPTLFNSLYFHSIHRHHPANNKRDDRSFLPQATRVRRTHSALGARTWDSVDDGVFTADSSVSEHDKEGVVGEIFSSV